MFSEFLPEPVLHGTLAGDGIGDEHPLVLEGLACTETDVMPHCTATVVAPCCLGLTRYMCTAALTASVLTRLRGRPPSLLSALVGPGLFFGFGLVAEVAARMIASRVLQRRAAAAQRAALLADVQSDFAVAEPPELQRETRITCHTVWVSKASFGVTPIWFRRVRNRGWVWTTDLRHWQSVKRHRSTAGLCAGLLPVESNRWLLRRLYMRDLRDRVRAPRAAHAPPPLSLPTGLEDAPAEFLCPIAHTVMTDPVIGPAGISYERGALQHWLELRKTDPSTQGPLEMHDVYANLTLRSVIAAWADTQQAAHRVDGTGDGTSGGASEPASEAASDEPSLRPPRERHNARARRRRYQAREQLSSRLADRIAENLAVID